MLSSRLRVGNKPARLLDLAQRGSQYLALIAVLLQCAEGRKKHFTLCLLRSAGKVEGKGRCEILLTNDAKQANFRAVTLQASKSCSRQPALRSATLKKNCENNQRSGGWCLMKSPLQSTITCGYFYPGGPSLTP